MTDSVIRIAGPADGSALAALRRAWTEENDGPVTDEGYGERFLDWYEREAGRRVSWLAEAGGQPVGMMNLIVFERMPRPGRDVGAWGYLTNAFVLARCRGRGIGGRLIAAVCAHADAHGCVRVVLRPAQRAIPFYERAGFVPDGSFHVRYAAGR